MTDDALHCDDCGEQIRTEQRTAAGLLMTCGCDKQRSVRVATVLPDGWSA